MGGHASASSAARATTASSAASSGSAERNAPGPGAAGEQGLGHDGVVADAPDDDARPEAGPFPEVLDQEMAARVLGMRLSTLPETTRRGEVPARKVGCHSRSSRPAPHRRLGRRTRRARSGRAMTASRLRIVLRSARVPGAIGLAGEFLMLSFLVAWAGLPALLIFWALIAVSGVVLVRARSVHWRLVATLAAAAHVALTALALAISDGDVHPALALLPASVAVGCLAAAVAPRRSAAATASR